VTRKILLIDDDRTLITILSDFFMKNNFKVFVAYEGKSAYQLYLKETPDILLLDLDLPLMNGFELAELIRKDDALTPIIMMTGTWFNTEFQIKGYELGAIQFLDKPFSLPVLLAQILSIVNPPMIENVILCNGKQVRLSNQIIRCGNRRLTLREKEAKALALLIKNQGTVVSRKLLQIEVWGVNDSRYNKFLDNLIYELKKKLNQFPELNIKACYSKGYMLVASNSH
jgi:DNA-binding response OmpR family regulator